MHDTTHHAMSLLVPAIACVAAHAAPIGQVRPGADGALVGTVDARLLQALPSALGTVTVTLDLPLHGPVELVLETRPVAAEGFAAEVARVTGERLESVPFALPLPRAFSGSVRHIPGSRAFIGVGTGDGAQLAVGFVELDGQSWWISSGPLEARRGGMPVMVSHGSAFADAVASQLECAASTLPSPRTEPSGDRTGGIAGDGGACGTYQVAIDTDMEFTMTAHGGNTVEAGQYALLLMAAATEIYQRDVGVSMPVSYLRLWTGEDPWTQSGMVNQLYEFRDHWNASMGRVSRHVAHYFAGRGLGGGVAWLSVVCGNRDFAYGLSSGLGYGFPYPLVDNSNANWEPVVVNHELGHNFGAPHTHDHNPQADGCGSGNCKGAEQGTIMSYCHQCPGGIANFSLRFHPYSIASMQSHLASVPCSEPGIRAADDDLATITDATAIVYPLANDSFVNCGTSSLAGFDATSGAGGTVVAVSGEGAASPGLLYSPPPGFVGADSFSYVLEVEDGSTAAATVHVSVLPLVRRVHVLDALPGIVASWYALAGDTAALPDFREMAPYGTAVLPSVDIASTDGEFSESGRADQVGATFDGFLVVPATGLWTISVESDDGSRVRIGDQLVVDNDGLHGMVERFGVAALQAGLHPIRVEFFENYGGAGVILRWEGPGAARQVVPAGALVHGGTVVRVDLNGDGTVGALDLTVMLAQWGGPGSADFNRDGAVDAIDLAVLLAAWD